MRLTTKVKKQVFCMCLIMCFLYALNNHVRLVKGNSNLAVKVIKDQICNGTISKLNAIIRAINVNNFFFFHNSTAILHYVYRSTI